MAKTYTTGGQEVGNGELVRSKEEADMPPPTSDPTKKLL